MMSPVFPGEYFPVFAGTIRLLISDCYLYGERLSISRGASWLSYCSEINLTLGEGAPDVVLVLDALEHASSPRFGEAYFKTSGVPLISLF